MFCHVAFKTPLQTLWNLQNTIMLRISSFSLVAAPSRMAGKPFDANGGMLRFHSSVLGTDQNASGGMHPVLQNMVYVVEFGCKTLLIITV